MKSNSLKKNEKTLNKKKVMIVSIVALIVLLIIVNSIIYQKNDTYMEFIDTYILRKKIKQNELNFISIENSNNMHIYAYSDKIVILKDNYLKVYNKYGNEEQSIEVKINQPIFETNEDLLCIAEKGGHSIYVIDGRNVLWQKQVEGNISNISINKNGYVAVAILGTSYKTVVETYNDDGTELFKTYLSTSTVIDTTISSDDKYLAIAEINFSGTAVQSNIKIISINEAQKNSAKSIIYNYSAPLDDLIVSINYNSKDMLLCMYDGYIDYIVNEQNHEITKLLSEDTLFADINLPTTVIKVVKKNTGIFKSETELQIINVSTQKNMNYQVEDTPKKVCVYDNNICLNLGSTALFISDNGWLIKEYIASQEIQKIVLGNSIAGIIYNDKIEIILL